MRRQSCSDILRGHTAKVAPLVPQFVDGFRAVTSHTEREVNDVPFGSIVTLPAVQSLDGDEVQGYVQSRNFLHFAVYNPINDQLIRIVPA